MQLSDLPQNDPFLQSITNKLKKQEIGVFLYSIRNGNNDLMKKIIQDNFNKKQSQMYYEKLTFWIRRQVLSNKGKNSTQFWSKSQIVDFLSKRVKEAQKFFDAILESSTDNQLDILEVLFSKSEVTFIMPHIEAHVKKYKQENSIEISSTSKISQESFFEKRRNGQKILFNSLNPEIDPYYKYGQYEQSKIVPKLIKDKNINNKIKTIILDEIQEKLGLDEKQTFLSVKSLLQKGLRKKANAILRDTLSKRDAQYLKKKICENFEEKINMPLPNAVFYQKNETGLSLYELSTQSKLGVSESQMINVMIVGMTGVGKTTFLNSLVNYLMDVQMEDNFRYIVSKDGFKGTNGKSATKNVVIYGIPKQGKMKKAMRLIDIPGLGDTDGINKDKKNLLGILEKIKNEVPFLNLILYVFKASQTRVTKEAEYVLGQIMGMFGKDMGQNIRFILTFADKSTPRVLDSLQTSFLEIIKQIKLKTNDWYLIVNNSALFQKIDEQSQKDIKVKVSFYQMGLICLQKTLQVMQSINPVNTKQSQNVMTLRNQLQQEIKQFQNQIIACLKGQQQIRKLIKNIGDQKQAMQKINYKYEIQQVQLKTTPTNQIVTTCLNCKWTCHLKCSRSNQNKHKCMKMKQSYCTACPAKCHWTTHINDHLIIKREIVKISKTYAELEKTYKTLQSSKTTKQSLIINLFDYYTSSLTKIKDLCQMLQQKTDQLSNIQLKKVNHLTVVQYIDILINKEKFQKGQNYLHRIQQYETIKSHHKRLSELLDKNEKDKFTCFAEQMTKRVKELIPDAKMANQVIEKVNERMKKIQIFQNDLKKAQEVQMLQYVKNQDEVTTCSGQ